MLKPQGVVGIRQIFHDPERAESSLCSNIFKTNLPALTALIKLRLALINKKFTCVICIMIKMTILIKH